MKGRLLEVVPVMPWPAPSFRFQRLLVPSAGTRPGSTWCKAAYTTSSSMWPMVLRAFTAAGHRRATHRFNQPPSGPALPGNEAFGIHAMHPGRFAIFVGGFPIEVDGAVVGGIGVSGGSGEQDTAVATAALEAFQRHLASAAPS